MYSYENTQTLGWNILPIGPNSSWRSESRVFPDNVVTLLHPDNALCGRVLRECEPVDLRAARTARGLFYWIDEEAKHPHSAEHGFEWTGGPEIQVTDSMYLFPDVTDVTP